MPDLYKPHYARVLTNFIDIEIQTLCLLNQLLLQRPKGVVKCGDLVWWELPGYVEG
jgi:hypothetical protein